MTRNINVIININKMLFFPHLLYQEYLVLMGTKGILYNYESIIYIFLIPISIYGINVSHYYLFKSTFILMAFIKQKNNR